MIELMIAMAVLAVGLLGGILVIAAATASNGRSKLHTTAVTMAESTMEKIVAIPKKAVGPAAQTRMTDCAGNTFTIETAPGGSPLMTAALSRARLIFPRPLSRTIPCAMSCVPRGPGSRMTSAGGLMPGQRPVHSDGDGKRQADRRKWGRGGAVYAAVHTAPNKGRLLNMKRTPNPAGGVTATNKAARGYTLLEMLISLLILATVTGAVFEQINHMQKKSSSEAMKLDLNQQAREFLDQTVRDLHMAGYPGPACIPIRWRSPPRWPPDWSAFRPRRFCWKATSIMTAASTA